MTVTPSPMHPQRRRIFHGMLVIAGIMMGIALHSVWIAPEPSQLRVPAKLKQAVATVKISSPQHVNLPAHVSAYGNIMPWQEASIGSEASGLRLTEVKVNVGDRVRRGQLLATFSSELVEAQLLQDQAVVAEAQAMLTDAAANVARARELASTGALSAQQIQQYITAEQTAKAKLAMALAAEKIQTIRLSQTQVRAAEDGVISARSATVGAVFPAGQELFRLFLHRRLEWRAELSVTEFSKLHVGQTVRVQTLEGLYVAGRLRKVAPQINTQTRLGMVYVDLPLNSALSAGMFVRGEFEINQAQVLALPQSAVLLRDGYNYVFCLGKDSRVVQTKIKTGRKVGNQVEILEGLEDSSRVVISGGEFLSNGNLVREVTGHANTQKNAQLADRQQYAL